MLNITKIMDELIRHNKYNKAKHLSSLKDIGIVTFLREFGTVHLNPGRRTGKSTYIANTYRRGEDLVIVPSMVVARSYEQLGVPAVITAQQFEEYRYKPAISREYTNIFVDEPRLSLPKGNSFDLHAKLGVSAGQTFILIGE